MDTPVNPSSDSNGLQIAYFKMPFALTFPGSLLRVCNVGNSCLYSCLASLSRCPSRLPLFPIPDCCRNETTDTIPGFPRRAR